MSSTQNSGTRSPNLVLGMLLLVYTFNFLDRQILGILAQPIKADLQLTDGQFGSIAGIAFGLLYSVLAIPLALLADKTQRSWVIGGSLVIWSAFTALCGMAQSFWNLFLSRLGVAVGEAGGVAPSYALIADYFPPERRARALAIYSLGVPVGLALGTLLGAYIAALINWRMAFFVMGVAGILVAPIFLYLVKDKPKAESATSEKPLPLSAVFPILAKKPAFWLMGFAAGFSSLCGYGLATWTPSVLMRSFDFTLIQTGQFMGAILLVGGTTGVFMGGYLADKLGKGDRGWYARLPVFAWLITAPAFVAGLLSPSPWMAWPLLLIPNALNILWIGPVTTAVQHLVPRQMRATASASFLLINNLIGMVAGPTLIGLISDALRPVYGTESLRYAAVFCLGFYVLAAFLMWLAIKPLRRDWVEETDEVKAAFE